MDDKQNQENQSFFNAEILQQAGIGPIEMPMPPKKSRKKMIIIVSMVIFLLIIAISTLVLVIGGGDKNQSESSDKKIVFVKADEIKAPLASAYNFFKANSDAGYSKSKEYVHPKSIFNEATFEDFTGADTQWASCKVEEQTTYELASVVYNGEDMNSVYLNVVCSSNEGTLKFEYDLRETPTNGWTIFNIVPKGKTV